MISTRSGSLQMKRLDYIEEILEAVPDRIDGHDMVDIIINLIECYEMRSDWLMVAVCVTDALREIEKMERETELATKH